jgi:hypothetical protein
VAGAASPSPTGPTPHPPSGAREGFRNLGYATLLAVTGQVLLWSSVIALWVTGTLFANIPIQTNIAYGARGLAVTAGEIFELNYLLMLGAVASLIAFVLSIPGYSKVGKSTPGLGLTTASGLATIGAVGSGMFVIGWVTWLGSFAGPGANPAYLGYASVMDSNLSTIVGLLLWIGGGLAFLGVVGTSLGSWTISDRFDEGTLEIGSVLSAFPVISIIGQLLCLVGFVKGERRLASGWSPPPPPPPPPIVPPMYWSPAPYTYVQGPTVAAPGQQPSWDSLAVALIVVLLVLWAVLLPFAFILSDATTKGPGGSSGGVNGPSAGPSSGGGGATFTLPVLVIVLIATAGILPVAVSRNRRKRRRFAQLAAPPPPPPPPPTNSAQEDPLDHLV